MAYRLQFIEERCTGCFTCHIACMSTHCEGEEMTSSYRTTRQVIKSEEGFQKNVCPGCNHCGICSKACKSHAIYKEEKTGFILTEQDKCTGCGVCEATCPLHVIQFAHDGKITKCDGCIGRIQEGKEPACVQNCPVNAIVLVKQ